MYKHKEYSKNVNVGIKDIKKIDFFCYKIMY